MKQDKKYLLLLAVFALLIVGASAGYQKLSENYEQNGSPMAEREPSFKEEAGDFSVENMEGEMVQLSEYFGRPIVINFWATWCGPCRSELDAFNQVYLENQDEIQFFMVNLTDGYRETIDGVKGFVEGRGYTFPVYFDTQYEAANSYHINGIPHTVFIDENGILLDSHIGAMSETTLKNKITDLFGGDTE